MDIRFAIGWSLIFRKCASLLVDFCVSGGLLALWKAIPIDVLKGSPGDRRLKPPLPRPRPGSSIESGTTYAVKYH